MPKNLLVTLTLREQVLQQHSFQQSCVKIGRHRACDVVIDNPAISRVHAEIITEGESYRLFDRGSSNGTLLNGAAPLGAAIKDGDVITLGKFTLYIAVPEECDNPGNPMSSRDVTIRSGSESRR